MLFDSISIESFKDVRQHCWALAQYIYEYGYHLSATGDWLTAASAIQGLKYGWEDVDPDFGWCGPADTYFDRKGEILQEVTQSLAIFSFVWAGLEALITTENYPAHPRRRGKIQSLSWHLDQHVPIEDVPAGYELAIDSFLDAAHKSRILPGDQARPSRTSVPSCSAGVTSVYRLRNRFAHGAMALPDVVWTEDTIPSDAKAVDGATALVLLTIQMALYPACDTKMNVEERFVKDFGVSRRPHSCGDYLRSLHLLWREELDDEVDEDVPISLFG